jgi:hypothetical protein
MELNSEIILFENVSSSTNGANNELIFSANEKKYLIDYTTTSLYFDYFNYSSHTNNNNQLRSKAALVEEFKVFILVGLFHCRIIFFLLSFNCCFILIFLAK